MATQAGVAQGLAADGIARCVAGAAKVRATTAINEARATDPGTHGHQTPSGSDRRMAGILRIGWRECHLGGMLRPEFQGVIDDCSHPARHARAGGCRGRDRRRHRPRHPRAHRHRGRRHAPQPASGCWIASSPTASSRTPAGRMNLDLGAGRRRPAAGAAVHPRGRHLARARDRGSARRPPRQLARALFEALCAARAGPASRGGSPAARFGADMQVSLINDGPVTFNLRVPPVS